MFRVINYVWIFYLDQKPFCMSHPMCSLLLFEKPKPKKISEPTSTFTPLHDGMVDLFHILKTHE
jgi:hypothetical protein